MKHIAVPNSLIFDPALAPSAKRVALALLTFRWENKALCKPLRFIAERSAVHDATAAKAIRALEHRGFLTRRRRHARLNLEGKIGHAASDYTLHVELKDGYTLIPYTMASNSFPRC